MRQFTVSSGTYKEETGGEVHCYKYFFGTISMHVIERLLYNFQIFSNIIIYFLDCEL